MRLPSRDPEPFSNPQSITPEVVLVLSREGAPRSPAVVTTDTERNILGALGQSPRVEDPPAVDDDPSASAVEVCRSNAFELVPGGHDDDHIGVSAALGYRRRESHRTRQRASRAPDSRGIVRDDRDADIEKAAGEHQRLRSLNDVRVGLVGKPEDPHRSAYWQA